jgi:hypothetical protein
MTERQNPIAIDAAVMVGDLSDLTTEQRADYYRQVCESLGLNKPRQNIVYVSAQ